MRLTKITLLKKKNLLKTLKNSFIFIFSLFILGCSSVDKNSSENIKPEYLIIKGMNLKKIGEYSKALALYKEALKKDEKSAILYEEIGETYTKLGDYSKGIKYYKKALAETEYSTDINRNISYIYYLKGDYKNSLKYLNKLYDNELDLESKKLKAFLLIETNKKEEARNYLKNLENSIQSFDKTYYETYLNFLLKEKDYQELSKVLYNISNKYYSDSSAMTLYFTFKEKISKALESLEKELKRYIVTQNGNDELYILLATLEQKLKKYKERDLVLRFVSPQGKLDKKYIKLLGEKDE